MNHPLLYEINTRSWLRELSRTARASVTLADVPESEFTGWQRRGFTHSWLMGVWTSGERTRAEAFKHADLLNAYNLLLPGWSDEDIAGSPYAIGDYHVPPALGGDDGLEKFRKRLHAHGMKLILDFVPNHLGFDHPWTVERPELFVQSPVEITGTFRVESHAGVRWLAHGKDPHFAPWCDTVQVDYRRVGTRVQMLELLQSVAARCDGVRCDMAMLLLNEVFAKTWAHLPVQDESVATLTVEFWADAIPAVRRAQPGFIFLAEVYWSLESRLQSLGFDYTYDKHLFDLLVSRRTAEVQTYLLASPPHYVQASAHFLENHDEDRIAPRLSIEEHRAAALLILGLPGMRFLHEGQLTGAHHHIPVQMGRAPVQPVIPEVAALYEKLLTVLPKTAVGHDHGHLLRPTPAWDGNPTAGNFIIVQWQAQPDEIDLVVINLAPHRSQCFVSLAGKNISAHDWQMRDLLGSENYERFGDDLAKPGLYLDVSAYAAQIFRFNPK